VRGHFIVDAALNALILANALTVPLPQCSESVESEELSEITCVDEYLTRNIDLTEAAVLYEKLMQGFVSADHIFQQDILANISDILQRKKEFLKSYRTAVLWLQYMDMIDILRKHIRAERTGNWKLHLEAVSDMLPYMAATGHNNYTKSAANA